MTMPNNELRDSVPMRRVTFEFLDRVFKEELETFSPGCGVEVDAMVHKVLHHVDDFVRYDYEGRPPEAGEPIGQLHGHKIYLESNG